MMTGSHAHEPAQLGLPKTINVGSGYGFRENCLNLDILPEWNPDWIADLSRPLPFGEWVETRRFGRFHLRHGLFDSIIAYHVLEHIPNLVMAVTNFLHLLREGGTVVAEVPYDLSYGAWQDPTHVRAFNERSWLYFTHMYWYLGWDTWRFDRVNLTFVPSDLGKALLTKGFAKAEVLTRPRAIDAMRVILHKRALTPEEIQAGRERRPT